MQLFASTRCVKVHDKRVALSTERVDGVPVRRALSLPVYPTLMNSKKLQSLRGLTVQATGNSSKNGAVKQLETVSISELKGLCTSALRTLGYNEQESQILQEVMFYAQLRDNNQGLIKITSGGLNRPAVVGEPFLELETRISALINGNNAPGMLVLSKAMDMAVERARTQGFGIVGTNHTSTSTGALGYYADKIGRQGLIAIVLAQSPEFVAPHGAKQPIFGTNPIAISIPSETTPVTMDMATSSFAWFGLLEAKTAGTSIPADIGYSAAGLPTTDPAEVLAGGALRSFDRGHKGSHLGLMVELLAGPLVGAAVQDKMQEKNWGNLVIALDPAMLGDAATFKQRVNLVLERVKGAEKLPGVDEILLPGERGNRMAAQRLASGQIPIEGNLLAGLRLMASKSQNGSAAAPRPRSSLHVDTRLVHFSSDVEDPYKASGPPLYQTATFAQPSATSFGPYDYTRSGNPTRTLLEEQVAALEGADKAFAFTSGMAAIAAVCRLVKSGEHIVAGEDIYGGTSRLLSNVVPHCGVSVTNVDMTNLELVSSAILPGRTKLVIIESPTNPRMQICDIKAISDLAHAAGAIVMMDNSIMTFTSQRPLELGADISMTSGTKFIGGHGDVTLGLLAVKGEELAKRVYFLQNAEGAGLAPFDCWLALRGLKTMALRMERAAANAAALAAHLARHPLVKKVNYPGLSSHAGYEIHKKQATSGGALLSFETGSTAASTVIVEDTQLFKITVSFGNTFSLISLPCYMSHASIPAHVRAERGLPDDLVRISAGIEHPDDLVSDLDQAMKRAMDKYGVPAAAPPPAPLHTAPPAHISPSAAIHARTPLTPPPGLVLPGGGATSASGLGHMGPPQTEREAQLMQQIATLLKHTQHSS